MRKRRSGWWKRWLTLTISEKRRWRRRSAPLVAARSRENGAPCSASLTNPQPDDLRDAPSLVILPEVQAAGARIVAYDPEGVRTAKPLLPGVEFADNAYACLKGADAAVIVTEWDEFRALDLARVKASLATPIIV